jgi:branched-chain amino acid transport system substrate-binding protein
MKVAHIFVAIVFALTVAVFTNPAPAAGEKTFGGAISQTGRYAEPAGRFVNSYKMFADQQNAKGGLLGQKMKLIILDDKSDK